MSLKQKLINIFEENKGKELSGQFLADSFGVTCADVWTAISSLKSEGYPIIVTHNKGYIFGENRDILSEQGIRKYLDKDINTWQILVLPTVDSTNTYAKSHLDSLNHPAIITASEQTAGRGRRGHSFYSPKDTGIYMSLVIKPDLSPATLITAAAAVAVCKACKELTDCNPQIKWVNDIYVNKKKICGILTEGIINFETQSIDTAIVGIGVNISTDTFPEDVQYAGSLMAENLPRNQLIGRIASLLNALLKSGKEEILAEYKSAQMVLGQEVSYLYNGESHTGTAIDINEVGNLIVKTKNGTDILTAGEISISKDFMEK